jgi:hypothetical protein
MYDDGNEISELLADGWDYDEAVEWCEFMYGEGIKE